MAIGIGNNHSMNIYPSGVNTNGGFVRQRPFAAAYRCGRSRPPVLVVEYWPEYGAAGKEQTTVDDVLSHLAGIPGVTHMPRGRAYHWEKVLQRC